jgi:hypothetical protein
VTPSLQPGIFRQIERRRLNRFRARVARRLLARREAHYRTQTRLLREQVAIYRDHLPGPSSRA